MIKGQEVCELQAEPRCNVAPHYAPYNVADAGCHTSTRKSKYLTHQNGVGTDGMVGRDGER